MNPYHVMAAMSDKRFSKMIRFFLMWLRFDGLRRELRKEMAVIRFLESMVLYEHR